MPSTAAPEVTTATISREISEDHGLSHDSEYDDELGVLDSLDITIIDNEESMGVADTADDRIAKNQRKVIPFSSIHAPAVKFKNQNRNIFIPGEVIRVSIIENERSVTTHPINPNLYTIEFKHGPFVWTVKKRYKHIQHLHNQLKLYRASLNIPFPTKSHRERRNSLKNLEENKKRRCRGALPRYLYK